MNQGGIELACPQIGLGDTHGHGAVVSPLAGGDVMGAAADHAAYGFASVGLGELQWCAHGVADEETDEHAQCLVIGHGFAVCHVGCLEVVNKN